MVRKLRYMSKGTATRRIINGIAVVRQQSNMDIFKQWRLAPTAIELIVRRLKMWQDAVVGTARGCVRPPGRV